MRPIFNRVMVCLHMLQAYAAPEMSDKRRKGYDFRFDCWSYGVVLYVVLCGFHPFDPDGTLPVPEVWLIMLTG